MGAKGDMLRCVQTSIEAWAFRGNAFTYDSPCRLTGSLNRYAGQLLFHA